MLNADAADLEALVVDATMNKPEKKRFMEAIEKLRAAAEQEEHK